MPAYRRVLLVLLVLGVFAATYRVELMEFLRPAPPLISKVCLVDVDGKPVAMRGHVDLFALDRTLYMPSPMPLVGRVELEPGLGSTPGDGDATPQRASATFELGTTEEGLEQQSLILDAAAFPRSLQAVFHVPGFGVDFLSVELGKAQTFRLRLGPAVDIDGVVHDDKGKPVRGARVIALGGNSRGAVLAEAVTDASGRYRIEGISSLVDYLTLRILKSGFVLAEREHWLDASPGEEASKTAFKLEPVAPVEGRVRFPDSYAASFAAGASPPELRVSVLQYAGTSAAVGRDGRFTLHHLKTNGRYRILLRGLPLGFTHRDVRVVPGQRVELEVVPAVTLRGIVVSETLDRPLPAVELRHQHTTRGHIVTCVTDSVGAFELRGVPVGEVLIRLEAPESHFGGFVTDQLVMARPEPDGRVTIRIK